MAKQLNVNLSMTADTSQARKQLQDLQNQLTNIAQRGLSFKDSSGLSSEIQKSITAAAQLKVQLKEATNVNTGKLDLSKFNESLKKSGMQLKDYKNLLGNLGAEGDAAFASLARSITQAEIPLKRTSKILTDFKTALANTTRWQISSSAIHAIMGSFSQAYGYAKDLNESLNNIRIVTGQSVEEMTKFAERANQAAKALRTTTIAYSDAALIFYQQGIRDNSEIEARTNATIKMAQVTGDNATQVSSYMTAIWNNFDDGSKSLEHYADVITALGASTASSSAEIAQGLEKFASIGRTVGLSYDYATSALATIVATTRQSADTVGTALKTIFSRLEGLNLGGTLEDGTTLNKYSTALEKVGVSIKDTSGELKDMDTILDELGERWQSLTRDEKMALAQTVAGVRQYNQLIALMDNWDFMQENLITARNSEGTLEKQAEIYQESWEAASKRVRANLEEIYAAIFDDKVFIQLTDTVGNIVKLFGDFTKGIGGLGGVLSMVGFYLTKAFSSEIATSIDNITYSLNMMTEAGRKQIADRRTEANQLLENLSRDSGTSSGAIAADVYANQAKSQQLLIDNAKRLNNEETQVAQILLDQQKTLGQQLITQAQIVETKENDTNQYRQDIIDTLGSRENKPDFNTQEFNKAADKLREVSKEYTDLKRIKIEFKKASESDDLKKLTELYKKHSETLKLNEDIRNKITQAIKAGNLPAIQAEFKAIGQSVTSKKQVIDATDGVTKAIQKNTKNKKEAAQIAQELADKEMELANHSTELEFKQNSLKNSFSALAQVIKQAKGNVVTFGQVFNASLNSLSSLTMGLNTLKGLFNTLSNDTISFGDKILAIGTSLPMAIGMLTSSYSNLHKTFDPIIRSTEKYSKIQELIYINTLKETALDQKAAFMKTQLKIIESDRTTKLAKYTTKRELSILAEKLGVVVTKEMTVAEVKEAIAAQLADKATKSFYMTLLPFVALLGLVAAGVWGLSKAWEHYKSNTPEAKLEAAKENSQKWADALENVKKKANDIKAEFGDYDSIVDKLNDCKNGSQEWFDVLEDVNDKAKEIIEKYDLIEGKDFKYTSSGIQFTDEAQKTAQKKIDKEINNATIYSNSAKQDEIRADNAVLDEREKTALSDAGRRSFADLEREYGSNMITRVSQADMEKYFNENQGNISYNSFQSWADANNVNYKKVGNGLEASLANYVDALAVMDKDSANRESTLYEIDDLRKTNDTKLNSLALENVLIANESREGYQSKNDYAYSKLLTNEPTEIANDYSDLSGIRLIKKAFGEDVIVGTKEGTYKIDGGEEQEISDEQARQRLIDLDIATKNAEAGANIDKEITKIENSLNMFSDAGKSFLANQFLVKREGIQDSISLSGLDLFEVQKKLSDVLDFTLRTGLEEALLQLTSGEWLEQSQKSLANAQLAGSAEQILAKGSEKDLSEDQISKLEDLESKYAELGEIQDRTSYKYLDTLRKIQEQEEDNAKVALKNAYDKQVESVEKAKKALDDTLARDDVTQIEVKAATDEFEKAIKELEEADYETQMKVLIDADLASDVDEAFGLANEIDRLKEYIPQNLEITFDRAQQIIAAGYGDILAGAEETANSTIKLNKDVLNDFIDGKQEEIEEDKKSKITQLENQKTVLQAQKQVLTQKLTALNKALTAGTQAEAEAALTQAQIYNQEYQAKVDELNKQLKSDEDIANETETINEQLFNDLGGMYDQNSANYQQSESEATSKQAENINIRINNLRKQYKALCSIGNAVLESATGPVKTPFKGGAASSGAGISSTKSTSVTKNKVVANEIQAKNTDFSKYFDQSGNLTKNSKAAIDAMINQTNSQINTIDDQIGAIDAGIAALKSADKSLNKLQEEAGSGSGGKDGKAKAKDKMDKDPNKYKKVDQEAERYHQINKELEQTSQKLEDIDRKKSRAYGSNKVEQIQAESNVLAKQAEQYDRLAKEAERYYKNDAAKMIEYGAKIEDGVITNYETLMKQQIDTYNAGYDAYVNAMNAATEAFNASQDEAAYEAAKKQAEQVWQGVQDSYTEFTDNMGKFEDSAKQWKDAEQQAEETKLKIYDNELEVIETMVSTWENFYEISETHMDFLAKLINESVNYALDRMINYAEQAQLAFDKINIYTDGFDDVLDHIDSGLTMEDLLFGDFEIPNTVTDKDIDTLKEYANNIKDATEKMLDMRKAIVEELGTAFNDFNSNIKDTIGKIDVLKDYISTYQNIIDIAGKKVLDPTGELTRKLINTTYLQARENTKMLRSQLDFQEKAIAEYNEKIANLEADNKNGRHDYIIEELKKQLKEAEQEYEATQSEWLQSWEETVQGATDIYENAVHDIIKDLDAAIAGAAGTLSQLQEQFERGKIIEDEYVDDFKKIYELNKLNKDIIKSIDETDNIKGKQELKKLQEEINQLQEEGVEMSEYDLENLRRKYELELARQQLEEARNAKSQVRMTRDSEGNWGYVYTADQDAVADAENNYADKLYAMQEANTQYIRDLQDSLIAFDEECTNTLEEIMLGEGTLEEKKERYNQALAFYQEHMDYLYAELEKATSNNKELYDNDWAAYNALTGYKISADKDFIDDFNETLYSQLTGLDTIEDAQNAFKDATNSTLGEVNQAWNDWYINTQEGLALGGMDIDNYAQSVEDDVNNRIIPATEDLTDEVDKMAEEATRDFSDMADYVQDFAFDYDQYIMDCIEITNEYIEALERLIQTLAETQSFNSRDNEDSVIEGDWKEVYDDNGNLIAWDVYDKKTGKRVNGNNVKISWGGNDIMQGYISEYNVVNGRLQTDGRAQIGSGGAGTTMTQEEIDRLKKNGMATGGYTGNWNSSDGKIAMLHEKELVLNKEDTSNILSAVNLIRQISKIIDLNAMTMGNGFIDSMIQSMQFDKNENIEQEVHITAEFPNATDKNEILEAFDNVINLAAQYAQRN